MDNKQARVGLRMRKNNKHKIQIAASEVGVSMSEFIRKEAIKSAESVLSTPPEDSLEKSDTSALTGGIYGS